MYVFGGHTIDGTDQGDLTTLNLSSKWFGMFSLMRSFNEYPAQRWTVFQDIGQSPSARGSHAMACDGTRVFVLGGELSPGPVDEAKPIHVLYTGMYFLFVISFG